MCAHNLQMQMNDFTLFQLWNFIQNEWANTVHHFLFSFLTNEMKIVKNTFWKTQNTNEQQRLNENSSLTENDENNSASHCTRNKNWEIQLVNENAVIKVKSWIYSDVLGFFSSRKSFIQHRGCECMFSDVQLNIVWRTKKNAFEHERTKWQKGNNAFILNSTHTHGNRLAI